jgi:hypothetical protein
MRKAAIVEHLKSVSLFTHWLKAQTVATLAIVACDPVCVVFKQYNIV